MIIHAAADSPDKQIKLLWYCFSVLNVGAMTMICSLDSLYIFALICFVHAILNHILSVKSQWRKKQSDSKALINVTRDHKVNMKIFC